MSAASIACFLAACLLLVVSCSGSTSGVVGLGASPGQLSGPNTLSTAWPTRLPDDGQTIRDAGVQVANSVPPVDRTWVSPGEVVIDHFYPGGVASYPISVHNGGDSSAVFDVAYRVPDNVTSAYKFPPTEAQDWVIIADPAPIIASYATKGIMVTLDMPESAESPEYWEFWTSVKDTSQDGFVKTELCTRWLISMR